MVWLNAQTILVEGNVTNLRLSDCSDCTSSADPRIKARISTQLKPWSGEYANNRDNVGCDGGLSSSPGIYTATGVLTTETWWVDIRGFESDGFVCGGNDGVCDSYGATSGISGVIIATWAPSCGGAYSTYSASRTCTSGGTQTYTCDTRLRYHWEAASLSDGNAGGSISFSVGTDNAFCVGHDPSVINGSSLLNDRFNNRQWQSNLNGGGWTDISGQTGQNYDPGALAAGTWQIRRRLGYCTSFGGAITYVYSNTLTITVTPDPIAPTLAAASPTSGSSFCVGQSYSATFNAGSQGLSCTDEYRISTDNGGTWAAYTPGASLTATVAGTYLMQGRRNCSGTACDGSAETYATLATWTVVADPIAPTLNLASPSNGSTVCVGQSLSATFNAGSQGLSCTDEYQYSTDGGGSWLPYASGGTITTAAPGTYIVQGRRNCSGSSCDGSAETYATLASWTVVADPIAPTLNVATPTSGSSVCIGAGLSATFNAGSQGSSCADEYQYSTNGGGTWVAYTPGSTITAAAAGTYIIQGRRNCTGGGCDGSAETFATLASWTVVDDPIAPTLNIATPASGLSVCVGESLSAIFNAGSQGISCSDEYQYSIDGGGTWASYTPGAIISASTTGIYIIQGRRNCTGSSCDGSAETFATLASWTVVADPVAPTLASASPANGTSVCVGASLSASFNAGSAGASCTDEYQYTPDGGATWLPYTSGVSIAATTAGSYVIQGRRLCSGNSCDGPAENFANLVNWAVVADPVAPIISSSPADATVCIGATLTLSNIPGSGGTGSCTDEYSYSTDNGGTWSSWSTSIPSITAVAGTTLMKSRRNCAGLDCNTNENQVSWTVVADPSIGTQPISGSICNGGTYNMNIAASGGSPSLDYQWESSPNNLSYTPILGANSASYTTPALSTNTYYRCVVTAAGPGCGVAISDAILVTVVPDPTISITADQTLCGGETFSLNANLTGGTACTINWESSPNNAAWASTGLSGASISTSTNDDTYYRAVTSCGSGCDVATSNTVFIDVLSPNANLVLAGSGTTSATNFCDVGVWTYYRDQASPDDFIFAINWAPDGTLSAANATAKAASTLSITSGPMVSETTTSYGTWVMGRYWNVNAPAFDEAVNIRFYYDPAEKTAVENAMTAFTSASNNVIDEGFLWFKTVAGAYNPANVTYNGVDVGNTIELTGSPGTEGGLTYVQLDGLASFSGGTGATGVGKGNALPIDLLYFTGAKNGDTNRLNWATASEENTAYFEVERSKDGLSFEAVARVAAAGNSSTTLTYVANDMQPLSGISYYRLRTVDLDNSEGFSNIISLERAVKGTDLVALFPNPASTQITYQLMAESADELTVKVIDALGRVNSSQVVQVNAGLNSQTLEISKLSPGLYYLQITCCDGQTITQKFVKD
jgi:hypothetical protein